MKKSHDILRTTEDIFYREIAWEWLEYSEFRLKESSYAKYRSILTNIFFRHLEMIVSVN